MRKYYRNAAYFNRLLALLAAVVFCGAAVASTLQELSFTQVAADAELVFEGEVIAKESQYVADGSIRTFVRFAVLDVIKGDYQDSEIDLSYLGGQVGGRQMRVSDMQMPGVGEVGIYFVESIQDPLVSPLVGWAQGHYVIERRNGQSIVKTAGGDTVIGVSADTTNDNAESNTGQFSSGVAKGVLVPKSVIARDLARPMSVDDFKRSVLDTLDVQQP